MIDEAYAPGADGLTGKVAKLLADLLYDPYVAEGAFSPDYTGGERDNLLDRIAAQKNDPRAYAPKRLTELMCKNEPYGASALGTADQAKNITANKLYAAYQRALSEAQIELFYCGTLPAEKVEALFAPVLPERKAQGVYVPHAEIVAAPAGEAREVVEEEKVGQGKLSLGFRTGGNCMTGGDPLAYWVFQVLYGGSTSSKLFLNVREKKSLCYYASAQFVSLKGVMLVNSGIENDAFETARDEILRQLQLCKDGDISPDEIESARKTLTGAWRAMLDEPMQLERYWLMQAIAGTLLTPEERIEALKGVTRERVVAAAGATALDTVYFMKGVGQ